MKCPSCSTEIADKAIVCYRCGTPTAIPEPVRPPASSGRGRLLVLMAVLAALAGLLLFTYLRRSL